MSRIGLLVAMCLIGSLASAETGPVDFNRDIRPVLSDKCFHCHGPDKNHRKAGLRLDTKEGLLNSTARRPPVTPGNPEASHVYRRLVTPDDDDRMPPESSGKRLTPREVALIKQWIEQGAPYKGHWSYQRLGRPQVPRVDLRAGHAGLSPIDLFLEERLRSHNLAYSFEADRPTLIRRLYLDLSGLPPTPEQVQAFVNDKSDRAYPDLVESLLANPHFGERMAVYWLDLVRYADTIGYHSDNSRDISPYRDWVIAAFNANMPFDRFTREQLAGDLLPNPTTDQKIASAYNRLLQTTEEGGAQPKEYAAKYLADRVRNVSSVWLAATMTCAECHDHKFDPYTMKDFYSLGAFFADVKEPAVGKRGEGMLLANEAQKAQLAKIDGRIAELKKALETATPELARAQEEWERTLDKKKPLVGKDKKPVKEIPAILAVEPGKRTEAQTKTLAAYYRTIAPSLEPARQELAKVEKQRAEIVKGIRKVLVTESQAPAVVRVLPRGNWMSDAGEVVMPTVPHFLPQIPVSTVSGLNTQGSGLSSQSAIRNPQSAMRPTRLDLANWLTSRENPLTARVFMNRLWKLYFGTGLSKTLEDLGSQGEWPTHPELLDWLAAEFQESGWDIKHMVRLIVTSAAYRQSSVAPAKLMEIDPFNRLIARQSRFRIDAEFVRDNALFISGLLDLTIGGESVRPYQPDGYWDFLNFPKRTYTADSGPGQYRRGLYVWWQRTFPQPSLVNFDAPSREECTCERSRSNTPQQALTLLNDPTYVEAARVFAARALAQRGSTQERIGWAMWQAVGRAPRPAELTVLAEMYAKHREAYGKDRKSAEALVSIGQAAREANTDVVELAAWTNVARAILNLHEVITRN